MIDLPIHPLVAKVDHVRRQSQAQLTMNCVTTQAPRGDSPTPASEVGGWTDQGNGPVTPAKTVRQDFWGDHNHHWGV